MRKGAQQRPASTRPAACIQDPERLRRLRKLRGKRRADQSRRLVLEPLENLIEAAGKLVKRLPDVFVRGAIRNFGARASCQHVYGNGIAGIDVQGPPVGSDCFVQPVLGSQNAAQVRVRLGIVGYQPQRLLVAVDGLPQFSVGPEGNAQVVVGFGIVGPQLQGSL